MTESGEQTTDAAKPGECFFALRSRAYELADSGRYKGWNHVAYVLLAEGFLEADIMRLDRDPLAVLLVTRNCRLASGALLSSCIRKWFGRGASRFL